MWANAEPKQGNSERQLMGEREKESHRRTAADSSVH